MNQNHQHPTIDFEDRLLGELRAIVAERAASAVTEAEASTGAPAWRRSRLVFAGAAATAVATAVLVVGAGGGNTPAAYAVEPQPEGMVSVEIRSLEDAKGLEAALDDAGIPASVDYLAAGMACKEPRFRPASPPGGNVILTSHIGPDDKGVPKDFVIGRDAVGPGQTLVITASPGVGADGDLGMADGYAIQAEVAEGSVAPCEPIPAPAGT